MKLLARQHAIDIRIYGVRRDGIGLGNWTIGGDWSNVSAEEGREPVRTAPDAGIDFIDTADVYGDGFSERRITEVLDEREARDGETVATKAGRRLDPPTVERYNYDNLSEFVDQSGPHPHERGSASWPRSPTRSMARFGTATRRTSLTPSIIAGSQLSGYIYGFVLFSVCCVLYTSSAWQYLGVCRRPAGEHGAATMGSLRAHLVPACLLHAS